MAMINLSKESIRKVADEAMKLIEKKLGTSDFRARDLVLRELHHINTNDSLIDMFEKNPENLPYQ